jgi:uncharacterized protein YbjT (DUF2867 family)
MQNNSQKRMRIFVAGGTGYIGRALIPLLIKQNHFVQCLVREKSVDKLPAGCVPVFGNALDNKSYIENISLPDVFIHLVGVSHPNPSKKDKFRKVDLVSLKQSVEASAALGIKHFIYVSVAHPAPLMKDYIKVRIECEEFINVSGLSASILRPWYILGPSHRWPYVLIPFYKLLEKIPLTAVGANRLGLVTLRQITNTLLNTIRHPADGIRIIGVPEIRNSNNYK